ncbi:MAG: amino acid adenylation domain-containing protein [Ruegeria sp.]
MLNAVFLDDPLAHFAHATPQADAISMVGGATSYNALERHVNRIAAHLLSQDVQRGDRVILCAAKSPHVVAALYAILRVGAVYVPIDPAAPSERMLAQIKAVAPNCVLADTARAKVFADLAPAIRVFDFAESPDASGASAAIRSRAEQRDPEDPAYILMTSGTTGVPKGIVHTHKSGLAYARMAANLCGLCATDRVSNHTPVHFDMSIFDIFSTALAGACVVIIPEMHTKLPASLSQLAEEERISVWYSVPFALIQMAERGALASRDLSALRVVMFAGEKMPPAPLKSFAAHAPNAQFLNAYGPTETNHCTTARMTYDDLDGVSPIPIGHADAGVTARIGETLPEPESGELLISSDQVMREYWQDPAQTDQRFCVLPDANGSSKRFYRTGDIVRRAPDGQLLLVGREDRQIKLRGFRIELDEVELVLTVATAVTEAAVVVSNNQIHAFVSGGTQPDVTEIKTNIAAILPWYAIPESIEWLEQMPRTSTGKIDRVTLLGRAHARHAA